MSGSVGAVNSRSLAALEAEAQRNLETELGNEKQALHGLVSGFRAKNPDASEKQVVAYTASVVAEAYSEATEQRHKAIAGFDEQRDQAERSGKAKPRSAAKQLRDMDARSAMFLRDELKLEHLYREAAEARIAAEAEGGRERY